MRIVSLCPSLTELVFDLGAGEELCGITRFCVHPVGRVDAVEKVGGTKDPDVGRIVELAPDLVLFNEEENRRQDAEALGAAGVRVLNSFPKDCEDTAEMVRGIGAAIGRGSVAEAIALDIEGRARRVRLEAKERAQAGEAPVRWAYLIWRDPWMTVNDDTFIAALLNQAGGENVFADRDERYPTLELAEFATAGVDRLLLSTEPYPFGEEHRGEIAGLLGVDIDRVLVVDGELLSWHGSRTPQGIDYASAVMGLGSSR